MKNSPLSVETAFAFTSLQQSQQVRSANTFIVENLGWHPHSKATDTKRLQDENLIEQELLKKRLRDIEARSDDDRIIGKLQREIIAMRTTYRLFARLKSA